MAMRIDKTDPGWKSVENADKEKYRRQPQTEGSPSYVLSEVLEDRQNDRLKYLFKFDEENLPVVKLTERTRSTS